MRKEIRESTGVQGVEVRGQKTSLQPNMWKASLGSSPPVHSEAARRYDDTRRVEGIYNGIFVKHFYPAGAGGEDDEICVEDHIGICSVWRNCWGRTWCDFAFRFVLLLILIAIFIDQQFVQAEVVMRYIADVYAEGVARIVPAHITSGQGLFQRHMT